MKEIMENIGEITFISFQEAYDMKDKIREKYASLSLDAKEVYKWYYCYQLCFMTNKKMCLKDCLWSYIVGKDNITKKLNEEYEKFKDIIKKREKKYEKKPMKQEKISIYDII